MAISGNSLGSFVSIWCAKIENIDLISRFHKYPACILFTLQKKKKTIKNDKVTFFKKKLSHTEPLSLTFFRHFPRTSLPAFNRDVSSFLFCSNASFICHIFIFVEKWRFSRRHDITGRGVNHLLKRSKGPASHFRHQTLLDTFLDLGMVCGISEPEFYRFYLLQNSIVNTKKFQGHVSTCVASEVKKISTLYEMLYFTTNALNYINFRLLKHIKT